MKSKTVAVVDYGSGNLRSVSQAVVHVAANSGLRVEVTSDPQTVLDSDDLKSVLDLMGSRQIRRAPVVDKHGRIVGVIALGDLSTRVKEKYAGETLESISR